MVAWKWKVVVARAAGGCVNERVYVGWYGVVCASFVEAVFIGEGGVRAFGRWGGGVCYICARWYSVVCRVCQAREERVRHECCTRDIYILPI
jgi:hypothetical protein